MSDGFDDLAEAESSFGPGFDLIVGLLAVVLVALQLSRASLASALGGEADLSFVSESKAAFLKTLCDEAGATSCTSTAGPRGEDAVNHVALTLPGGRSTTLDVTDVGTNQTLRIGEEVLFESASARLKPGGREALKAVSRTILSCRTLLREVQVQGHADRIAYKERGGNLQLASDRAIVVYRLFAAQGIDPREVLLSAATYDNNKPVDLRFDRPYDWDAWGRQPESVQRANRRVELHLIYRLTKNNAGAADCSGVEAPATVRRAAR